MPLGGHRSADLQGNPYPTLRPMGSTWSPPMGGAIHRRAGQPMMTPRGPGFQQPASRAPNTGDGLPATNNGTMPVDNQGADYSNLMGQYNRLLGNRGSAPQVTMPTATPQVTAQQSRYTEDPRHTSSMQNLAEMAASGGYSGEDKAELRARGVSPIRAAYGNAMRGADRARSISGGYSPNAGASSARMAREQAGLIGDQISNVNAGIAERVAGNRTALAPQLNAAASNITGAQNAITGANTAATNRASEVNANNSAGYQALMANVGQGNAANRLNFDQGTNSLLSGAANLYGTTPARAATFGNQALQAQGQNTQQGQALIDAYLRANGGRG